LPGRGLGLRVPISLKCIRRSERGGAVTAKKAFDDFGDGKVIAHLTPADRAGQVTTLHVKLDT
jgi:hypothetical protein